MELALTALVWVIVVALVAVFVVWAVTVTYMGVQAKKMNQKAQKEFDDLWGHGKDFWKEQEENFWGGKKK